MWRPLSIGAAALAALSLHNIMPAEAKLSPDLIYMTDASGAIVFQQMITDADELKDASNGVFIHPFPITLGNPAMVDSPLLLTVPGLPYQDGVSDLVAVIPMGGSDEPFFASAVGANPIPLSFLGSLVVTPVIMPEGIPVNVTAYFAPGALPAGDSMFFRSDVPEASTWAMMLLGFAGLGYAGFRRAGARPETA